MEISFAMPQDRQIVESYGDLQFKVSGQQFQGSLLVFPERSQPWPVKSFDGLTLDSLAPVIEEGSVQVLLLGCGPKLQIPPPDLRSALREKGIGIEPMDTGAACRTYNVLLAEGRAVAAALIAVA